MGNYQGLTDIKPSQGKLEGKGGSAPNKKSHYWSTLLSKRRTTPEGLKHKRSRMKNLVQRRNGNIEGISLLNFKIYKL